MIYRDDSKYRLKLKSDLLYQLWGTGVYKERMNGDIIRVPIKLKVKDGRSDN